MLLYHAYCLVLGFLLLSCVQVGEIEEEGLVSVHRIQRRLAVGHDWSVGIDVEVILLSPVCGSVTGNDANLMRFKHGGRCQGGLIALRNEGKRSAHEPPVTVKQAAMFTPQS